MNGSAALYRMVSGAVRPWHSLDAIADCGISKLPQQEIDVCLMCPLHADACDKCDGHGNLRRGRGNPPKEIDTEKLMEFMRLKRCNKECCAALGISKTTLLKAKKQLIAGQGKNSGI